MRRPGGYAFATDFSGRVTEFDTTTCCHCSKVTHITPKMPPEQMGGWCRMCMKPTCPKCADSSCTPFERKLETLEARYHARRSYQI